MFARLRVLPPTVRTPLVGAALVLIFLLAPAASAAAAQNDIRLSIQSRDEAPVDVGERTCFTGRVTNSRELSVGNARVILGGKTVRTHEDGRFEICGKLDYSGDHTVYAFKGEKRDHATLEAGSGLAAGEWREIEIRLPAYHSSGDSEERRSDRCSTGGILFHPIVDTFGEDTGWCNARAESPYPGPFAGKRTQLDWFEQAGGRLHIDIYAGSMTLRGWMPSRGSGNLFITSSDSYPGGPVTGGSDVAKTGEPGGPFLINVAADTKYQPFPELNGYSIRVKGYVIDK